MTKKAKPEKVAATVTIRYAAKMTPKGRKAVAKWLRIEANCLESIGTMYTSRYTSRYRYR